MNLQERTAPKARSVLEHLAQGSGSADQDELIRGIESEFENVPEDEELVGNGRRRWVNALLWQTTGYVKAGWMLKDGKGTWTITDEGRAALASFPEPIDLKAEADRLYRVWDQSRKVERRAWLVRGFAVRGVSVVPGWLEDNLVGIDVARLPEVSASTSVEEIRSRAERGYQHLNPSERRAKVEEIEIFVNKMSSDDVVVTTNENQLYVGDVNGTWSWQNQSGRVSLLRQVEWRNRDAPIDLSELPAPFLSKLASDANVVDLTAEIETIDSMADPSAAGTPQDRETEPGSQTHSLPQPDESIAAQLFVDLAWLRQVRDLLQERRQIVFYGPPGTGKTYIARKLAEYLVGPEQVKFVQFHPSYTYEDFFEGYRPIDNDSGGIAFELKPGPLRQMASRSIDHNDQLFILVIDEINRANLAKVFGELYFLLEYRDQAVELLYSSGDEPFRLPPNIFIIGTMNTADRSIALVDAAMRRRFAFVALDPREEPTKSLLGRWSRHHSLPSTAADLLRELNERIDDPDFQIGPSYFMRSIDSDAFDELRLSVIWQADILPLLEEHFYGQWASHSSRFALRSLLNAVTSSVEGVDSLGDSPAIPDGGSEPGGA